MKRLIGFMVVLFLFGVATISSQQLDEAQAPQKVKDQLLKLRSKIQEKGYHFTVGYNPALNYSINQLCGLREPVDWLKKAKEQNLIKIKPALLKTLAAPAEVGLPAAWNWCDQNACTPIRDQGSCGSCWAFATIAALESNLLIKDTLSTDLSEQQLVSCNTQNWGCNGGWWAHDMLVNPGAVLESDFPYAASDLACGGPYNYPYKLSGWAYIDGDNKVPDTDKIKEAIYQYGPVNAAVYVGTAFQSYTGGVFDQDESPAGVCGCTPPSQVNHAICLVGWDEGRQAWRLRNSWGTGWGESGYMWIKYSISNVGYAAVVAY